ncbi:homoserine kinase [Pigmentiphaga soli]|uniref:Homoserine kinase n=1 Tax=Pigmentiphaga soli TaxID=1007095 RepID=A0ABP8GYX8_9BURK
MAVFTPVDEADARDLLARYPLGDLISLRGIASGIENTNYFLTTGRGEFVLTVFERLTREQLPFYIELMRHLAERTVPVPDPQATVDGQRIAELHGKPCAIVTRLPGQCDMAPAEAHCALVGAALARMHLAGRDFPLRQPNLLGLDWWRATAPVVAPYLGEQAAAMLLDEVRIQAEFAQGATWRALPEGPAHCDLFRDNVLFAGTPEAPELGGFIDFYFAGCDRWLFDVAVCLNDWCVAPASGEFRPALAAAFLRAYAGVRPFEPAEYAAWAAMLRAAALRFWISRLFDFHLPRPAQTLTPHDPTHFERILRLRRTQAPFPLP